MIPITLWIVEDDTTYRRTLQRMLSREKISRAKGFFHRV